MVLLASTVASASIRGYVGEARDDTGRLLYEEHHLVRFGAGQPSERLVTYRCADGRAFARKQVDYADPPFAPQFRLDDARLGYQEGFDRGEAFVRRGATAAEKRDAIRAGAALVVDAGFDEFVRANWDALQAGDSLAIEFLVPSRLTSYKFKLRKVRTDTLYGEPTSIFELAAAGLLGWFADPLEAGYRDSDRRLMHFKGLTNIRKTLDDNFEAQIRFPPEREAAAPDEAAWTIARAEALGSCTPGG